MTRTKNKNKKKNIDQNSKTDSEGTENSSGSQSQGINSTVEGDDIGLKENTISSDFINEGMKGRSRNDQERIGPTTADVPLNEPEVETFVDKSLDIVQGAWKLWVVVAMVAAMIGIFSNLEVDENEILIVEKGVALTKTRASVFQYVGDLRNYKQWYPGIRAFDEIDATPMGIGKHFTEVIDVPIYGTFHYDTAVIGYESPRYISFVSDSYWMIRTEIEILRRESSSAPTLLKFRVYSRCKSYLFRYVTSNAFSLMYGGRIRQALFNLRMIYQK